MLRRPKLFMFLTLSAMLAGTGGCGNSWPEGQLNDRLKQADPYASASHVCDEAEEIALGYLGRVRRLSGGPSPRCLPQLHRMVASHAAYLAKNRNEITSSHRQRVGRPGFTGKTLQDRVQAAGLDQRAYWISEGVGGGFESPEDVVQMHLATVYHRSPLLSPGTRYFAFAAVHHREPVMSSMIWTQVKGLEPAVYPWPEMTGVPRMFTPSVEHPVPPRLNSTVGFPISIHFPRYLRKDGREPSLEIRRVRLRAGGKNLPVELLYHQIDPLIYPSDLYIVPLSPLARGTRHTVEVSLNFGRFKMQRQWTFTTRKSKVGEI